MTPTEHELQSALIQWATLQEKAIPELANLFAIPNGAHKSKNQAMKFKREGLKAGVADLFLAVARGGYHGYFIEIKRPKKKPRKNQLEWRDRNESQGYKWAWFDDWEKAKDSIIEYLKMEQKQ